MDYLIYAFAGLTTAFIGALPPGAVNLAVVYITINKGGKDALPIIFMAALGEIILSFFALHFTMTVEEYIQRNIYVQYAIALLLIIAGLFLLFKPIPRNKAKAPKKSRGFLQGILLSVLNPPVLIFWLVAFAFLSANTHLMLHMGRLQLISLFFLGVFLGKILALWVYLQLSKRIAAKASNITSHLNKGISLTLVFIGLIQLAKLVF
ncbi:MAG: LysE family transporter [Saprospiraceae bacterium]